MQSVIANSPGVEITHVHLEGGPDHLRGTVELATLDGFIFSNEKIKIRHLGGYEHYESAGPANSRTFRWSGRTKIAE